MKQIQSWFSLIEIMVGILIVSFISLAWFQALSSVGIGKIKLIERTNMQQEAYFMSEKLFELIKTGGTIDYEEYWNRHATGTLSYSGWHFSQNTAFWNEGTKYYCLSGNGSGSIMWTGGCLTAFNRIANATGSLSYSWQTQVYNSYKSQFVNYNGDYDNDFWNEDASTESQENFKGDDDDLFLWIGPDAFPYSGSWVTELYLINNEGTERTYFRWKVRQDPYAAAASIYCNFGNGQFPTGSGCLGTIQMLKLTGVDEGYDHGAYAGNPPGWFWDDDGEIDTWLIHKDFDPNYSTGRLATFSSDAYWQDIFPDTIHVKEAMFFAYPNVDLRYAWKDARPQKQIAPYVQIKMILEPSYRQKLRIAWAPPQVPITTTIHLSDFNFQ